MGMRFKVDASISDEGIYEETLVMHLKSQLDAVIESIVCNF